MTITTKQAVIEAYRRAMALGAAHDEAVITVALSLCVAEEAVREALASQSEEQSC